MSNPSIIESSSTAIEDYSRIFFFDIECKEAYYSDIYIHGIFNTIVRVGLAQCTKERKVSPLVIGAIYDIPQMSVKEIFRIFPKHSDMHKIGLILRTYCIADVLGPKIASLNDKFVADLLSHLFRIGLTTMIESKMNDCDAIKMGYKFFRIRSEPHPIIIPGATPDVEFAKSITAAAAEPDTDVAFSTQLMTQELKVEELAEDMTHDLTGDALAHMVLGENID